MTKISPLFISSLLGIMALGGFVACGLASTAHASVPTPSLTLSSSASSIVRGDSITISWNSTGVNSCNATRGAENAAWSGTQPTSGSQVITTKANGNYGLFTYQLTCTGAGGTISKQVSVHVASTTSSGGTPPPPPPPPDYVTQTALRAGQFLDSLGVNTHFSYAGPYQDPVDAISELEYLGIHHIRDGSSALSEKTYTAVAQSGAVTMDLLVTDPGNLPGRITAIKAFLSAFPNAISSFEGPNEVNNFPISFGGYSDDKFADEEIAANLYQKYLYTTLKSSSQAAPSLASYPVFDYTGTPVNATDLADYDNYHIYPHGTYFQPEMKFADKQENTQSVGKPAVITENGYHTLVGPPVKSNDWEGVDQRTQAKLVLNSILDATKFGFHQIYLYELIDEAPDPNLQSQEDHFGLFSISPSYSKGYNPVTPKVSAVAIHNLTTIFADSGGAATTFTPDALSYKLTGMPTTTITLTSGQSTSTASSLLFEKSNGTFELVLWNEPQIWNTTTYQEISITPQPVTVSLSKKYNTVNVYSPIMSASPINSQTNVDTVVVSLGDSPIIVEISNLPPPGSLGANVEGFGISLEAFWNDILSYLSSLFK